MRLLAFLLLAACSSRSDREPPSTPPPAPAPLVIDATPIAPGTLLRAVEVDFTPTSLVVTPNAIYYAALQPGVYMVRDGKSTKLYDGWVTRVLHDDDAIYFVARSTDKTELVRKPFVGEPAVLETWNGWAMAVDDEFVYLKAFADRGISQLAKRGGTFRALPCKGGLAADRDHLYCTDEDAFVRFDRAGEHREVLGRIAGAPLDLGPALTERYIYAATDRAIVRVPKAGGAVETVAASTQTTVLVGAGSEAYWATAHRVRRMTDGDRTPADFADGFNYARALFVAGTTVFVADSGPNHVAQLQR